MCALAVAVYARNALMPAHIRDNRRALVKKQANRENMYKNRIYLFTIIVVHVTFTLNMAKKHVSTGSH